MLETTRERWLLKTHLHILECFLLVRGELPYGIGEENTSIRELFRVDH